MKHKVSELTGALLDAAVAKAEGRDVAVPVYSAHGDSERDWSPSTEWADGGPIIERWRAEKITFERLDDGRWSMLLNTRTAEVYYAEGETQLQAAMRTHVVSKFGQEVEL